MGDPILWAGFVMAAGLAGAALARSLRGPAATGALLAGLALGWAVSGGGSTSLPSDLGLFHALGIAFFGFLTGAELDPATLTRRGARLAGKAVAQVLIVAPLAWLAGQALGLETRAAAALGVAAATASPVAIVAVASEARARGGFTRECVALSSISLVLATAVVNLALGPPGRTLVLAAGIAAAAGCGLLALIPLSRMASRGAILACVGLGLLLISGVSGWLDATGSILPMVSILAGLVACAVIPNRALVVEALRDLATPCAVGLFAISGLDGASAWPGALAAAALLLAARATGLLAVEALAAGARPQSARAALAQLPMAWPGPSGPGAVLLAGDPTAHAAGSIMSAASALAHAIGMIATRWGLRRSGDAALADRDPDAWRAAMR